MNPAPAHLEAKLRLLFDLTVGQIAMALIGVMFGGAWAMYLSPLHGTLGLMTGVYLGGLFVVPVVLASQTDFDLGLVVVGAMKWRRREGRYLPGPGQHLTGYCVLPDATTRAADVNAAIVNLDELWEENS